MQHRKRNWPTLSGDAFGKACYPRIERSKPVTPSCKRETKGNRTAEVDPRLVVSEYTPEASYFSIRNRTGVAFLSADSSTISKFPTDARLRSALRGRAIDDE